MALDLHKVMSDGTTQHEDCTKEAWNRCIRDPAIKTMWGHRPDDCHDPVERFLASLPQDDPLLDESQGDSFVEVEPEPVLWPPPTELQPWLLAQLAGLCIDDAKDILAPPRKILSQVPVEKRPNKHGQFSLFD